MGPPYEFIREADDVVEDEPAECQFRPTFFGDRECRFEHRTKRGSFQYQAYEKDGAECEISDRIAEDEKMFVVNEKADAAKKHYHRKAE